MKRTFKLIVVMIAMIGFTFAGCEGPVGPEGGPGEGGPAIPAQVINMSVEENLLTLYHGILETLTAVVYPDHAMVQTVRWELYDVDSGEVISLRRPGSNLSSFSLSGDSVEIFALSGGEARIRVIALGGGVELVRSTVIVTVRSVVNQFDNLRKMDQLPGEPVDVPTVTANDLIRPQLLCFDLDEGDEITIILRGTPGHTLRLHNPGVMFTVGRGVTLVLENVALQGMGTIPNNNALVVVNSGGALEMRAGSRITGNNNTATGVNSGGGVRVGAGGTFVMNDGEILDNQAAVQGGGVFNHGTFTMNGGVISGNDTNSWGGGVSNAIAAIFEMTGGTISGNSTGSQGGGVRNSARFVMYGGVISGNTSRNSATIDGGGGVHNATTSVFDMRGGEISGNTANHGAGVNVATGTSTLYEGGKIFGNTANADGGGVRIAGAGRFIMRGGEISGNTARANGGGVRNLGTFRMYGGEISSNYARWATVAVLADGYRGGGVFNAGTSSLPAFFDMMDGAISYNVANWDGGGVTNFANGVFRMHGGRINDNTAGDTGFGFGGGVFNQGAGIFSMHGGEISGNTAHAHGGGVKNYFGGIFRIGGGVIHGNDAELPLRNAGIPGAALYTDTLRAQSWVVELYEDGTVATPPGTLLRDPVFSNTIRVENGNLVD